MTTPEPLNTDRFFLTGYMGAGKSTIGKLLARSLGYEFVDTDRVLVKQFGKSISRIFSEDGEETFRKAEADLLKELAQKKRIVISTGGGTLAREETMSIAKNAGTVIYLRAPVEDLFERVIFSRKDRPMIDVPDAETVFAERFKKREPFYNQADLIVDTTDTNRDVVIKTLVNTIKNNARPTETSL